MAQLGARLDGIEEVVGSNPIGSTKLHFVLFSAAPNELRWRRLAHIALKKHRPAKKQWRDLPTRIKYRAYGQNNFSRRGRHGNRFEISG